MTGRRYLEWDYGSDLGPQYQTQGEAAQSLSQLEKLAIGSYSQFLKEEPGRSEKKNRQAAVKQDYLPDSEGEDMRANRFSKFADSLMRQREMQQQERVKQHRRSVSRERLRARQEGEVKKGGKSENQESSGSDKLSSKSPLKSSSMSDIPIPKWATHIPSSRSTSTHSLAQMSHNLYMSGPSSSSSAGTVVAVQNKVLPGMFGDLSIISTP